MLLLILGTQVLIKDEESPNREPFADNQLHLLYAVDLVLILARLRNATTGH